MNEDIGDGPGDKVQYHFFQILLSTLTCILLDFNIGEKLMLRAHADRGCTSPNCSLPQQSFVAGFHHCTRFSSTMRTIFGRAIPLLPPSVCLSLQQSNFSPWFLRIPYKSIKNMLDLVQRPL